MKKGLSVLLTILIALPLAVTADQIKDVSRPTGLPSFLGYVPDRLIVVMKDDVGRLQMNAASNGVVEIGHPEFDALSQRFAVSAIRQQFPGTRLGTKTHELAKYHKVTIESGTLEEALEAYANNPLVEHVEPIGIHAMFATPNDTYYSPYQWHHNQANDHDIDSPEAWDIQTGNSGTIIAILDSGTRYYHPDLGGANATPSNPAASRGNMWINTSELNGSAGVDDDGNGYVDDWIGYDFIDGVSNCWSGEDCNTKDNDPRDFNGHGTHTAGIFGMITNDGYGMAGVAGGWGNGSQQVTANGVRIMPLRMGYSYNYLGQEYGVVMMDAAAEAFYYAADNGASIASCSWGSSNSGGIGAAATYFINNGGLIFVAAGNDGSQTADYLNGRGDCISVAATDQNDAAASFTTYGTWVDISAPGVGIYSTYHDHTDPNTNYWAALDGTSMATPMAAGVAGLIWSQNPGWTASQVQTQLYNSADNIDAYLSSGYIGRMGVGRINAYNAVNTGPPPAPVAEFSGSPTAGTEPLTVNFTDFSTGGPTSWSWTFGDGGTSTQQNPTHQYTSAGNYTVSLTVSNAGGNDTETKTGYITVNPCVAPTASFVGSPTSGTEPLTVNFTDQSTGATSWSWNFGDGGSSTQQNPTHQFTSAGTYTVTLTATNACGSDQLVRTDYITVNPCVGPTANFVGSPTSGDAPLTVDFTDQSSGATAWSWNFGDGGSSTAQNPSHTYTSAGTYTVTLTATNSCGNDQFVRTNYITVTEPPVAYAALPYSTGFESGGFDQYWFSQSSNSEGRILVTTSNGPHSGSWHLTMDDNTNGGQYAQNEAWLRLNLAGQSDVELSFWWKEFSDESHSQDGVYFSDNGGSSFTKVYNLTGGSSSWQEIVLDVDQLASGAGLSMSGTFVVKFQQYDNYSISTDGMAFDDIDVSTAVVSPPVAEFEGSPTSGYAPLAVNFTDLSTGNPSSWSWTFGDGGSSTAQNPSHTYTSAGTYTVSLTVTNAGGNDTETKAGYITVSDPPVSAVVGEVGQITRNQTGAGADWYSVSLNNSYTNPVVVMRGLETNGGHPTHLRVRSVTGSSFQWQMEEWDYLDGNHTTEDCPYMVIEAGAHTLEDGTVIEAGTATIGTSWSTITFSAGFSGTPALLTGVASQNDGAAVITRSRNLGSSSFQIRLQEEEAADGVHSNETIAWIAIQQGTGTNDGNLFEAGRTPNAVTDAWYTISFTAGFSGAPIVLTMDDTYDGGNTCGTRHRNAASGSVEVFIEEEQSGDSEVGHIDEVVSWVAWAAAGDIVAASARSSVATTDDGDLIEELPETFAVSQNYPNPFNPATEIEFSIPKTSHVKLEVYNVLGQRVSVLTDRQYSPGLYTVTWDGARFASGIYFYRLQTEGFVATKKMVLVK